MLVAALIPRGRRAMSSVVCVAMDWTRSKDPPVSLGQASILASLRQRSLDVVDRSYSVNEDGFDPTRVAGEILSVATRDSTVAFGVFVWNDFAVRTVVSKLRQAGFAGRVVLGGPQISYTSSGLEALYEDADAFIRGYAEGALCELVASAGRPEVAGVHYAGDVDRGLKAVANLGDAPSPYLSGVIKPQPFMRLETQRGCPFSCTFCQHRAPAARNRPERFQVDRVRSEMALFVDSGVVEDLAILDPTFNVGPDFLGHLDHMSRLQYSGKLSLQCRFELVREDFLDAVGRLNQSGRVVLEFGLQTVHKDEALAIKRPNNMAKVARCVARLLERGIEFEVSLIFGLPLQTLNSFKASVQCLLDLGVPTIKAFPLMLLRGTELQQHGPRKYGLVESLDHGSLCASLDHRSHGDQDDIPVVVSSNAFTESDWLYMNQIANELERTEGKHPRRVDQLIVG